MEVKLLNVRLAFPKLYKAESVNGEGDPRFGAAFLFAPGAPSEKAVRDAIIASATEKWGAKAPEVLAGLDKVDKLCLHSGDHPDKAKYDGFAGNLFVSAGGDASQRPMVIGADKGIKVEGDPGAPYAGCYVNALIDVWAQDNKYGKRVNARLMAVQFCRDGDAFGGGRRASLADFDDVSAAAGASNPWNTGPSGPAPSPLA